MRKTQAVIITVLLFMAGGLFAETPKEAAKALKALYETKNFEKLVKERYTELHKAKTDKDVQKVIDMISGQFSKEKNLKMILSIYDQLINVEPTVEDNPKPQQGESGKVAVFKVKFGDKEIPFKLYQMKNGKWGFHL